MAILTPFSFRSASIFWVFVAWIVVLFLTGGSARGDISSLLVLRPAAILVVAALLFTARRNDLADHRIVLALMALAIALVALHLVPLPPAMWQALPMRELIARIDNAVGLGDVWRPLTIAPAATWNAFYALMIPLSTILFMIRFGPDRWPRLVPVFLALGLACMLLGLFQITAVSADSVFYPYRVSNFGAPVGLFANRNHTGAFLATILVWLAVFGSFRGPDDGGYRLRVWIMALAIPVVLFFLLLLGSRAGLLLGVIGLLSMPLLHVGMAKRSAGRRLGMAGMMLVGALAVFTVGLLASRAESLNRLLGEDAGENYRITTFFPILRLAIDYLPLGSGIGSFVTAYQRYEPLEKLEPRYLNHAHNDALELLLTGGLPAMALIAIAAFVLIRGTALSFGQDLRNTSLGLLKKAASVTLCLFALASIVDYPLRTPALLGFAAMMAVMVAYAPGRARHKRSRTGPRAA